MSIKQLTSLWIVLAALLPIMLSFGRSEVSAAEPVVGRNPISRTTKNDCTAPKPNILFIMLDDMGWKDTSYMGSDFFETPHIDKLAGAGMVFTNAYSCSANCAPARACLLSGQYTPRHQIYNVGTKPRGKAAHRRLEHVPGVKSLKTNIKTWAHQLQAAGYQTATMGKWHLSKDPIPYGFHVNVGGTHSGSPPKGYYPPHGKVPGLENPHKDEYLTDTLSNAACNFITANKAKPWMLYLTHFAVHTPIQAKKELVAKYDAKKSGSLHDNVKMATMIQAVDDGIGKIVTTLNKLGIRDNTVIMFCSDNGGYGPATDMAPLKGYKGTYYEGGIRVPFFVNWLGVVQPNQRSDEPIIGVDIYPTLCEIGGAALPDQQIGDGVSLVGLLKGEVTNLNENGKPRALHWHFPAYLQSYQGLFDEQRDPLFRSRPCSVIRKGKWKLIQFFESGDLELFNLSDDLAESTNVSQSNPAIVDELYSDIKTWQTRTDAAIPRSTNPAFDEAAEKAAIEKLKSRSSGKKRKKGSATR